MNNILTYIEAVESMFEGHVVKYVGTVNGDCFSGSGGEYCMFRGVIFSKLDKNM